MKREPAWRIFAAEFNASQKEIKGEEQKTPSYIVTPLGAKINRVLVVGVLTDVENMVEGKDFLRAHLSDPTGVYTLYSGQYQQEITDILANIEVPAYVAVVGKTRTYMPEEGQLFVSIRPELVHEVSPQIRDQWILETCKHTKYRLDAVTEALNMADPSVESLTQLDYPAYLAEGILMAKNHYQQIDTNRFWGIINDALEYVFPSEESSSPVAETKEIKSSAPKIPKSNITVKAAEDVEPPEDKSEEIEDMVLQTIGSLEGENGAAWDLIVEQCVKKGLDETAIEEALTSLMDKGFIFEPVLGTIKTT